MTATLHVCITCRGVAADTPACADCPAAEGQMPDCGRCPLNGGAASRPGARLYERIRAQPCPGGLEIRPVECLSACSQGCTVALSGRGKWSYVFGRLGLGDAAQIVWGAARYAATQDGLVPWRERPEIFRKQSLARIPPQETSLD